MSWPVSPAAYVLGDLPVAERLEAERLIAEDPSFRAAVERLQSVALRAAALPPEAWDPEPPPPLRVDLSERDPAAARLRTVRMPRWPRLRVVVVRPVMAALLAAMLVGAGVLGARLTGDDDPGPGTPQVAGQEIDLGPFDEGRPGARARVAMAGSGPGTEMRLTAEGLPPSARDDFYEVWLITADGKQLASVGTFRAGDDGRAQVTLPVSVDPARYGVVDVSREPDDGDPGHSSHSVLRAPI